MQRERATEWALFWLRELRGTDLTDWAKGGELGRRMMVVCGRTQNGGVLRTD